MALTSAMSEDFLRALRTFRHVTHKHTTAPPSSTPSVSSSMADTLTGFFFDGFTLPPILQDHGNFIRSFILGILGGAAWGQFSSKRQDRRERVHFTFYHLLRLNHVMTEKDPERFRNEPHLAIEEMQKEMMKLTSVFITEDEGKIAMNRLKRKVMGDFNEQLNVHRKRQKVEDSVTARFNELEREEREKEHSRVNTLDEILPSGNSSRPDAHSIHGSRSQPPLAGRQPEQKRRIDTAYVRSTQEQNRKLTSSPLVNNASIQNFTLSDSDSSPFLGHLPPLLLTSSPDQGPETVLPTVELEKSRLGLSARPLNYSSPPINNKGHDEAINLETYDAEIARLEVAIKQHEQELLQQQQQRQSNSSQNFTSSSSEANATARLTGSTPTPHVAVSTLRTPVHYQPPHPHPSPIVPVLQPGQPGSNLIRFPLSSTLTGTTPVTQKTPKPSTLVSTTPATQKTPTPFTYTGTTLATQKTPKPSTGQVPLSFSIPPMPPPAVHPTPHHPLQPHQPLSGPPESSPKRPNPKPTIKPVDLSTSMPPPSIPQAILLGSPVLSVNHGSPTNTLPVGTQAGSMAPAAKTKIPKTKTPTPKPKAPKPKTPKPKTPKPKTPKPKTPKLEPTTGVRRSERLTKFAGSYF